MDWVKAAAMVRRVRDYGVRLACAVPFQHPEATVIAGKGDGGPSLWDMFDQCCRGGNCLGCFTRKISVLLHLTSPMRLYNLIAGKFKAYTSS